MKTLAAGVLLDYEGLIRPLASRTNGLGAQFVNGNHDPYLGELDELNTKRGWSRLQPDDLSSSRAHHARDLFDPLSAACPKR